MQYFVSESVLFILFLCYRNLGCHLRWLLLKQKPCPVVLKDTMRLVFNFPVVVNVNILKDEVL